MDTEIRIDNWLSQVVIRKLRETDLPSLEWNGEYTHFRRVYADAYRRQVRGASILWVADCPPAGIIGQVFIQLVCDRKELADGRERAYLYSFRVRPEYRGKGLGSRMVEVLEGDLRRRHYHTLTLNVARENIRARALYERLGFVVVSPEPGIWSFIDHQGFRQNMEEPAWRMEKIL